MRGAARVVQVSIALIPPSALRLAIEPDAWAAFECEQLGSGLHVYTARSGLGVRRRARLMRATQFSQ